MTSGHGDYRTFNELPRQLGGPAETPVERLGLSVFADGVPEVLTASRDQMRQGAHFLKIFVGGAVSGLRDPLDIMAYSFEEIKAAADTQAVAISSFPIPVPHSPNSIVKRGQRWAD